MATPAYTAVSEFPPRARTLPDAARRAQAEEAARLQAERQAAEVPRRRAALARAVAAQRGVIAQMGIPERYLSARVMMRDEQMQPVSDVTLRDYIAALLATGPTTVGAVEARSGRHLVMQTKSQGEPIHTTLWRLDGNELYVAGGGRGDNITETTPQESEAAPSFLYASWVMMLNALAEQ